MIWLLGRVADERPGQVDPDVAAVGLDVALLDLVLADLSGQELSRVAEVGIEIVGMSDLLEGTGLFVDSGRPGIISRGFQSQ